MVKLIVADDHLMVRQAICEMLEDAGGFSVLGQASDGQALLDLLKSHAPDVILLDLQMPVMNGIEALKALRLENPLMPVVVLSADERPEKVKESLSAGARAFVPKNAGANELEFAIRAVLDGKTFVSPTVTDALLKHDSSGSESGHKGALAGLTEREIEILTHLADGKKNRDIGTLLTISTRTVDTHRTNILRKLNVKTNAELTKLAIGAGLVKV